jgi:hypothetical protein
VTSSLELLALLFVPGLFGLVVFLNWLEVYFTHQLVADEIAVVWQSTDSADDLEQKVGLIVKRVLVDSRHPG